ncbi:hypothetical protein BGW38_000780, partial [Lunasporangiospora selenospora]
MSTPSAIPPSTTPDAKGDMALFGKPSVVGSYNLTSGILIYSAFMLVFVFTIGSATWQRARYRNQFRQHQQRALEGGRVAAANKGGKGGQGASSAGEAAVRGGADQNDVLSKQASISKRALLNKDGGQDRSLEEREMANSLGQNGVRFGEGNHGSGNTNGGMASGGRT